MSDFVNLLDHPSQASMKGRIGSLDFLCAPLAISGKYLKDIAKIAKLSSNTYRFTAVYSFCGSGDEMVTWKSFHLAI